MADFEGQKNIFFISLIVLLLAIPISIAYAFYVDNYLKALYIIIYVAAALFVVFVPNWPWLNRNRPQWRPDSEASVEINKAKNIDPKHKRKIH